MSKLTVSVQQDHLERLVKGPLVWLAELVWNALDAFATEVDITTEENDAGGFEAVAVKDNGIGITPERAARGMGPHACSARLLPFPHLRCAHDSRPLDAGNNRG